MQARFFDLGQKLKRRGRVGRFPSITGVKGDLPVPKGEQEPENVVCSYS
jgi:hypothetical protein